jgi:hypothetical protein
MEEENTALRQLLEQAGGTAPGAGGAAGAGDAGGAAGAPRTYTAQELQREADRLATERINRERATSAKAEFDRSCNIAVIAGRTKFGEAKFDESLKRLGQVGFYGDDGTNMENLSMALETDDPAKVLHELAQNPTELYRIMDLPPNRRRVEFVKLSLKADAAGGGNGGAPARRPSGASPPIEPIGGRGGEADNRYSENVSPADWHAAEDKREREYWEKQQAQFRA